VRWSGSEWIPVGNNSPSNCFALGSWNGQLVVTGNTGASIFNGASWQSLGLGGAGRVMTTFDVDGPGPSPEMLIVGGLFQSAGGQPASRIAAWDGTNWHALGAGLNDRVDALAVFQNQLYVGGWFSHAGGHLSPHLARWGCPQTPPPVCYANCDGSTVAPVLNIDDFVCFINEFGTGISLPHAQQAEHYANCDGSTVAPVLNVDDFMCFINRFAAGCP
jgi:hypothetical protein